MKACRVGADKEALRLCYVRHAYGMGEHYNSIGGAVTSAAENAEVPSEG